MKANTRFLSPPIFAACRVRTKNGATKYKGPRRDIRDVPHILKRIILFARMTRENGKSPSRCREKCAEMTPCRIVTSARSTLDSRSSDLDESPVHGGRGGRSSGAGSANRSPVARVDARERRRAYNLLRERGALRARACPVLWRYVTTCAFSPYLRLVLPRRAGA